jgi:hypothetical protein
LETILQEHRNKRGGFYAREKHVREVSLLFLYTILSFFAEDSLAVQKARLFSSKQGCEGSLSWVNLPDFGLMPGDKIMLYGEPAIEALSRVLKEDFKAEGSTVYIQWPRFDEPKTYQFDRLTFRSARPWLVGERRFQIVFGLKKRVGSGYPPIEFYCDHGRPCDLTISRDYEDKIELKYASYRPNQMRANSFLYIRMDALRKIRYVSARGITTTRDPYFHNTGDAKIDFTVRIGI